MSFRLIADSAAERVQDPPLLEVHGLTVRFGRLKAVDNFSFVVDEGTIVGLIGANGAGKTTLLDAVTGFVAPAEGTVRFRGAQIESLAPAERARCGLARTFQTLELFEDLSVLDNVLVSAEKPRLRDLVTGLFGVKSDAQARELARAALAVVGVDGTSDVAVSELSHGERKLVAIARALALAPSVLLLDEPAAGLDTKESVRLCEELRQLPSKGLTVLLIEHDMSLVMSVCDYILVMERGALLAAGTPAEVRQNPDVIAAYLGVEPEQVRAAEVEG